MIREALDRAKTPSPQRKRLKFASLVCDAKSRVRRPRLLGRLTPLPKETWALVTQLLEARAGRRGVGKGCRNLIASASRALQLERVESQKCLPRESCGCTGLSPKLRCARLGRSRALGLRKRSSRAELLCLGGRGADGCNDFERAWGQS